MPDFVFTIPEDKFLEFKEAFLKENPLPIDSNMTEDEWMREWGRNQYLAAIERGKKRLVQESISVDPSIITCSSES